MQLTRMVDGGASTTWLGDIGAEDVDATVAPSSKPEGGDASGLRNSEVGRIAMSDDARHPFYVMRGRRRGNHRVLADTPATRMERAQQSDLRRPKILSAVFGWTIGEVMPMADALQFTSTEGRMIARDECQARSSVVEIRFPHRQRRPRGRSDQAAAAPSLRAGRVPGGTASCSHRPGARFMIVAGGQSDENKMTTSCGSTRRGAQGGEFYAANPPTAIAASQSGARRFPGGEEGAN